MRPTATSTSLSIAAKSCSLADLVELQPQRVGDHRHDAAPVFRQRAAREQRRLVVEGLAETEQVAHDPRLVVVLVVDDLLDPDRLDLVHQREQREGDQVAPESRVGAVVEERGACRRARRVERTAQLGVRPSSGYTSWLSDVVTTLRPERRNRLISAIAPPRRGRCRRPGSRGSRRRGRAASTSLVAMTPACVEPDRARPRRVPTLSGVCT